MTNLIFEPSVLSIFTRECLIFYTQQFGTTHWLPVAACRNNKYVISENYVLYSTLCYTYVYGSLVLKIGGRLASQIGGMYTLRNGGWWEIETPATHTHPSPHILYSYVCLTG